MSGSSADKLRAWADWYVSCAGGNIPSEAQCAYDVLDELGALMAKVAALNEQIVDAIEVNMALSEMIEGATP